VQTEAQKAVLVLLALDEGIAQNIVRELSEDDLRKLRVVAAGMQEVPRDAVNQAFRDFLTQWDQHVAVPRGKIHYLRDLSESALGDARARALFDEPKVGIFERLEAAPREALVALLADEPPQLVGALLSRLSVEVAASVLSQMPVDRQAAVIAHLGRMAEVEDELVSEVADALVKELPVQGGTPGASFDGVARAAEILNATGKDAARQLLEAIEANDSALASDVRQAMFTFEDLARLDARALRELLREVPSERLTYALKGAPPAVAEAIFRGLSSRAADLLRDDLEILTSVKRADIEAARKEMVQAALRLEADGRIDLGRQE
jgi:flagellar motor switch protein FliG